MEDKQALIPATIATPPPGTLVTLGLFFLGNGEAIRRLAAMPRLWLVGLLMTFSAGLAREYDAEYLLAEPWHLLTAPLASWAAATILWILIHLYGIGRWEQRPAWLTSYRTFLGLFWLTAPLAWLYGIPYERFMSPGDAAVSNLWTLALVACWRVIIIIRVQQALFTIPFFQATITTLVFSDGLMLLALSMIPIPIFALMGGVKLGAADQVLASFAFLSQALGYLALMILLPIWLFLCFLRGARWRMQLPMPSLSIKPIVILALAGIGWWCSWLPIAQPEQQLRWRTESALQAGDFASGLKLLNENAADQYPPHWDAPPRNGFSPPQPDPAEVLLYLIDHPMGPRLQEFYEKKFLALILSGRYFRNQKPITSEKRIAILERSPDASRLLYAQISETQLYVELKNRYDSEKDPVLKKRLGDLLMRYPKPQP